MGMCWDFMVVLLVCWWFQALIISKRCITTLLSGISFIVDSLTVEWLQTEQLKDRALRIVMSK
jgi:acetolactate synthase regulatory subunit